MDQGVASFTIPEGSTIFTYVVQRDLAQCICLLLSIFASSMGNESHVSHLMNYASQTRTWAFTTYSSYGRVTPSDRHFQISVVQPKTCFKPLLIRI